MSVAFVGCIIKVRQKRFFSRGRPVDSGHRGTNSSVQQCTTMMPISRQKRIIVYQKRNREPWPASRLESRKQQSHPLVHALPPSANPLSIHYTIIPSANIQDPSTHGLNASQDRVSEEGGRCNLRAKELGCVSQRLRAEKRNGPPPLCLTAYIIMSPVSFGRAWGRWLPRSSWNMKRFSARNCPGFFLLIAVDASKMLRVCSYVFFFFNRVCNGFGAVARLSYLFEIFIRRGWKFIKEGWKLEILINEREVWAQWI